MSYGGDPAILQQQHAQLSRLQLAALGKGPSIAGMQANAALEQGRRGLNSQAVSDRRNPALARRNAMIQSGSLATRIQQQGMIGRLAEQQQAEAALAQAVNGAREADIRRMGIQEQARTARFNALMGIPSSAESQANQTAQMLPMLGKGYEAWKSKQGTGAASLEAQNEARSDSWGSALSEPRVDPNPGYRWVTGAYGSGGHWVRD
jgi:hypothetical protein